LEACVITSINKLIDKLQKTIGLDLTIVLILASLLVIFALTLPDGNVLRILFGLPFLLFLPGYSLVSAFWVKKTDMDDLERIALSLGLSIALVPLVGLGLNFTPLGINLISIVLCMFGIIIVLSIIAWFRRSKLEVDERFVFKLDPIINNQDIKSSTDKAMVLIIAVVIIIGGAILFYIATNPPQEEYSELYIFDENGTTENYPSSMVIDQNTSIIIEVVCHELKTTDYRLIMTLHPETGANQTLRQYNLTLKNKEKWSQTFNFSVGASGDFKLVIELYKGDNTIPYVTNHLWINVS
jgi:uncharacterized membrane protein